MRLLQWIGRAGLICSSLLAHPGQTQNAPPPPPGPGQFTFLVCNNSGLTLFFVFIYLNSTTDARFRTTGWFSVNAGECPHAFGNFTAGKFYYFGVGVMANNTQYLVQGSVLQQCVHLPEAFDRLDLGGAGCKPFPHAGPIPPGDYLAGFAEVSVPGTVGAITVSIKPPY